MQDTGIDVQWGSSNHGEVESWVILPIFRGYNTMNRTMNEQVAPELLQRRNFNPVSLMAVLERRCGTQVKFLGWCIITDEDDLERICSTNLRWTYWGTDPLSYLVLALVGFGRYGEQKRRRSHNIHSWLQCGRTDDVIWRHWIPVLCVWTGVFDVSWVGIRSEKTEIFVQSKRRIQCGKAEWCTIHHITGRRPSTIASCTQLAWKKIDLVERCCSSWKSVETFFLEHPCLFCGSSVNLGSTRTSVLCVSLFVTNFVLFTKTHKGTRSGSFHDHDYDSLMRRTHVCVLDGLSSIWKVFLRRESRLKLSWHDSIETFKPLQSPGDTARRLHTWSEPIQSTLWCR